jgi:hypothetical protein
MVEEDDGPGRPGLPGMLVPGASGAFWVQVRGWVGERRVAWEAAE